MSLTLEAVMARLQEMGTEQTKKTFLRHGASEPLFGVKVGDLKKLVKELKKDQELAQALYRTGNSDAMYLAGLTVDPKQVSPEVLRDWAKAARWSMLGECTVAWVAAESPYALELAREWIESPVESIAICGWSAYAGYVSITPDERLDAEEIRELLLRVEKNVHEERNRVRYNMNAFVIAVGAYVLPLHKEAVRVAEAIGPVRVNVGQTACKVPLAAEYIGKIKAMDRIGRKKKTCIC